MSISLLNTLLSFDFRYTAINQLWKLLSGPALLIFIPLYLDAEAQGYWYTFISLAALSIFADLGFSTILLQFSAHEFAHLKFAKDKTLFGNNNNLSRLSSILKFSIRWSIYISFIVFPIIVLIGYVILNDKQTEINWFLPWIIYVFASVIVFINSLLLSFIEGCDSVAEIQKIRFLISFFNSFIMLLLLFFDTKLYALSFALLISAIIGSILIFSRYKNMLRQLFNMDEKGSYNLKGDMFPLLKRYSISWISGYFIFSIFTPITFHYYGSIEAGKVGLSIALCSAIYNISNIWLTIIVPKINILVSKSNYFELNNLFFRHLIFSIITFFIGSTMVYCIYILLKDNELLNRFVSLTSIIILLIAWFLQLIINSMAVYIRAHKVEPLSTLSFFSAIYVFLITVLIALYLPFEYYFLGFLSSYIWGLPLVINIFKKYKREN